MERNIILFGASWCAPCELELRNLPALAAAAAPDRLVIAWIDQLPPPKLASGLANVSILQPVEARRHFNAVAGNNHGLPVSVIFDAGGKPCAMLRESLEPDKLRRMKAACRDRALPSIG